MCILENIVVVDRTDDLQKDTIHTVGCNRASGPYIKSYDEKAV